MKTILVTAIVTAILAFTSTDELKGRWESKSETGTISGVVFKEDYSFEGYINKKPFVSGIYSYSPEDSVFTLEDNGCNGITGIYKINFYSNSDSMRFVAINDSCTERKEGMQRLMMGRVK